VVIAVEQGADCLLMVQLMPLILVSYQSRLVLPFWYWLTQTDLEKRLLNGCSSSCCCSENDGLLLLVLQSL